MEVVEGDPSTAPPATPPTHVPSSSNAYSATTKTPLSEKAPVKAPILVNVATEPTIKAAKTANAVKAVKTANAVKTVKAVKAVKAVNTPPVVKAAVKAASVDVLYDENLLEHTGGLPVFMDDTTRVWLERALSNDTKFLCDTRIMDYSLLVRSFDGSYDS